VEDSSFLRAYEISGDTEFVDLTEDIREAVLLAIPSFPVCSTSCKGLCPQCGANLNEGPCACRPPPDDNPWSGLENLSI
jgi:uncharacterized protein